MIFILIIIIGLSYAGLVLIFLKGWYKLPENNNSLPEKSIGVSIIIPARNEEDNIELLLNDLDQQDYPVNMFEVILVNDHSDDQTENIIKNVAPKNKNRVLLSLTENESGKKSALRKGIAHAKWELILTVDADCRLTPLWISSFVSIYHDKRPKIISGPVLINYSKNIFSKMQSLEFLSLIGSGAGAIGLNRPIMCNGANIAFEKKVYEDLILSRPVGRYASGDDMFLLLGVKSNFPGEIEFNKSINAIVTTKPATSTTGFMSQRKRWVSKTRAYRDPDVIITAILVFSINLFLITCIIASIFSIKYFYALLYLLIIKSIPDYIFLKQLCKYFGVQTLLIAFFPLQLIYPFYTVLTAIYGNIGKYIWKKRKLV